MRKIGDTLTRQAAEDIAARIRAYWAKRGKQANVWIDQEFTDRSPVWTVRSDFVNGLPRDSA